MAPPSSDRSQRATLLPPEPTPDGEATAAERIAAAVTREALTQLSKGGGTRGLWVAVLLLACAYGSHIFFGQDINSRMARTEALVEWLVGCKFAEQQGQACAPLPLGIRSPS